MSATESTSIATAGPIAKRRRRSALGSPAGVVMRKVPSVGSKAHLYYDPVTGCRLERPLKGKR